MPFITKTKTTKAKSLLLEQAQRDLAEQFRKCILVTYIMLLKCSQGLSSYFMSRRAQGLNGQLSLALSGHFWLLVMSIIVIKTLIISCYVYDPTFTGYWVTLSHRYLEYRNNDPAISVGLRETNPPWPWLWVSRTRHQFCKPPCVAKYKPYLISQCYLRHAGQHSSMPWPFLLTLHAEVTVNHLSCTGVMNNQIHRSNGTA